MRDQSRCERLRNMLADSLGVSGRRNQNTESDRLANVNEWNEEDNRGELELTIDQSVLQGNITPSNMLNIVSYDEATQGPTQFYINSSVDHAYVDNNAIFTMPYPVQTSVRLIPGYDIEVDADSNEPVSICVDRNIYDIEVLDDRIEIRRRFDNESNDNGAHDEPAGDSIQRSEDVLQQWNSEQNS